MHIQKQTNNYAQLKILFTHTHAEIRAENTYVHVNKYIHIPVQTSTFIHEQIKKIFDQNILNTKMFSRKNIFTVNKFFKWAYMHTKIHTQTHAQGHFLQTYTNTHTCWPKNINARDLTRISTC